MVRKPTAAELGAFIRRHRLARGMTQDDLGEQVGMLRPAVCRIERGHVCPSAAVWVSLVNVLDAPQFVIADA